MGGVSYEDESEFAYSSNEDQARTVVLVGKTGNGKSSTGNSILGRKAFKSKRSCGGVTTTCEMQKTLIENNRILTVIDTPGLFDYSGDVENNGREIVKCINMAKDGVHAFIVVLSVKTRFSREEEDAVKSLRKLFGDKLSSYMIVVFTGGDDLGSDTLDEHVSDCPKTLKEILEMCGNRCLLFDNKTGEESKKSEQLQKLLGLVDVVFNSNGGKPYTDELLAQVKRQEYSSGGGEKVSTLMGISEKDMSAFNEQHKMITEMVESKLGVTTRCLEEQIAKECAARLKAEAMAEDAKKKSDEESCILEAELKKKNEELVRVKGRPWWGGCAIL